MAAVAAALLAAAWLAVCRGQSLTVLQQGVWSLPDNCTGAAPESLVLEVPASCQPLPDSASFQYNCTGDGSPLLRQVYASGDCTGAATVQDLGCLGGTSYTCDSTQTVDAALFGFSVYTGQFATPDCTGVMTDPGITPYSGACEPIPGGSSILVYQSKQYSCGAPPEGGLVVTYYAGVDCTGDSAVFDLGCQDLGGGNSQQNLCDIVFGDQLPVDPLNITGLAVYQTMYNTLDCSGPGEVMVTSVPVGCQKDGGGSFMYGCPQGAGTPVILDKFFDNEDCAGAPNATLNFSCFELAIVTQGSINIECVPLEDYAEGGAVVGNGGLAAVEPSEQTFLVELYEWSNAPLCTGDAVREVVLYSGACQPSPTGMGSVQYYCDGINNAMLGTFFADDECAGIGVTVSFSCVDGVSYLCQGVGGVEVQAVGGGGAAFPATQCVYDNDQCVDNGTAPVCLTSTLPGACVDAGAGIGSYYYLCPGDGQAVQKLEFADTACSTLPTVYDMACTFDGFSDYSSLICDEQSQVDDDLFGVTIYGGFGMAECMGDNTIALSTFVPTGCTQDVLVEGAGMSAQYFCAGEGAPLYGYFYPDDDCMDLGIGIDLACYDQQAFICNGATGNALQTTTPGQLQIVTVTQFADEQCMAPISQFVATADVDVCLPFPEPPSGPIISASLMHMCGPEQILNPPLETTIYVGVDCAGSGTLLPPCIMNQTVVCGIPDVEYDTLVLPDPATDPTIETFVCLSSPAGPGCEGIQTCYYEQFPTACMPTASGSVQYSCPAGNRYLQALECASSDCSTGCVFVNFGECNEERTITCVGEAGPSLETPGPTPGPADGDDGEDAGGDDVDGDGDGDDADDCPECEGDDGADGDDSTPDTATSTGAWVWLAAVAVGALLPRA